MEIIGYQPGYKDQVIACLKRNFSSMKNLSYEYMESWIKPLTEYFWVEDIPIKDFPYKYGMLLLEDNRVVGYCGLIYSYIYANDNRYVYVNTSTWAIDSEFRIYVLKATKEMMKTADVISDFSAIDSMEEMNVKMFKYEYIDTEICKYIPVPSFSKRLHKKYINQAEQIEDQNNRRKYIDHSKYNERCVEFSKGMRKCYIFYKITRSKIKNIKNVPYVQIHNISDSYFFSEFAHEIIWYLQKKEWAFLEVDSRLINRENLKYLPHKIASAHRQIKNKTNDSIFIDNLYSEMAIKEH